MYGPGFLIDFDPPDATPRMRPGEPHAAPPAHTGWKLVLGHDGNGEELSHDNVTPPGPVRRWLTRLVTGWRWERV